MFINNTSKANININIVKINGVDLETIGLFLDKDFELSYVQQDEIEEIYIKGRDLPYHKKIRSLPIEIEIEFNIRKSTDFNKRLDYIKAYLNNSKEKIMTFNNETKGFRIYYVTFDEINREIGSSTVKVNFTCYPTLHSNTI